MEDLKRIKIEGKGIPVRGNDIDTDRIIPARFLKCVVFDGLGEHAFEDDRASLKAKGETHSFDEAKFQGANVLVVNKNFGCGSSREHAPQSIMRWGIQAVVGESFAEIFYGNCISLGIPCLLVSQEDAAAIQSALEADASVAVAVDVENRKVTVGDEEFEGHIEDGPRKQFLEGRWDSTAELLSAKDEIAATAGNLPYFNGWK